MNRKVDRIRAYRPQRRQKVLPLRVGAVVCVDSDGAPPIRCSAFRRRHRVRQRE